MNNLTFLRTFTDTLKKQRGGKREGSGAKQKSANPRQMLSIRLPIDLIDKLKSPGESQSEQIEKALRGFNGW